MLNNFIFFLKASSFGDPLSGTVDLVPDRSLLSRLLEKYIVGPVIGLEFVVEVLVGRADPEYRCALCRIISNILDIMEHLLSADHKLAFMVRMFKLPSVKFIVLFQAKFFPLASNKFISGPHRSIWTAATYDFLDTVANRIESKFARAEPRVVASLVVWENEKTIITASIEQGMHARLVLTNFPSKLISNFY